MPESGFHLNFNQLLSDRFASTDNSKFFPNTVLYNTNENSYLVSNESPRNLIYKLRKNVIDLGDRQKVNENQNIITNEKLGSNGVFGTSLFSLQEFVTNTELNDMYQ